MKILLHIFVLFCLFPYIDIFGLGTDTQPNALILGSLVLLAVRNKKINTPIILLWALFVLSMFLFLNNHLSFFIYLKNSFNYLSPPLVATTTYVAFSQLGYRLSFNFFLTTVLVYGLVGMVQLYSIPDFMTFLVNGQGRGVLVGGRGVISLCPEPAFYGSICLFFLCFSLLSYTKKQNYLVAPLLLGQIFFLGISATATAVLLAACGLFTLIQILRFRVKYLVYTSLFLLFAVPYVNNQLEELEETRMGKIAMDFIEEPLKITKIDDSVGIRFAGTVAPFLAMRHCYFLPMGIGNLKNFLQDIYRKGYHRNFLTPAIINDKDRLGGSMNTVLFQLGFLGLLFPLAIFLGFKKLLVKDAALFSFILFVILLFTQLQLMHSMIGFIIGYVVFLSNKKPETNPS